MQKTHVTINNKEISLLKVNFLHSKTVVDCQNVINSLLLALDGLTFTKPEEVKPFDLKEWRENIKHDKPYLFLNDLGEEDISYWDADEYDIFRRSIGNMFPNTEEGRKLLEAYKQKLIEDNK